MSNIKEQKGFTLVEIAIVIMFTGFFALIIGNFFKSYTDDLQRQTTKENLELAHAALYEYFGRNGFYPCPADPTLAPGDANYGIAVCRDYFSGTFDPDDCVDLLPVGNVQCTTESTRDADNNGADDVVMMGVIPFQTLADYFETLASSVDGTPFRFLHRKDGYNTLLSYAVSERMTNNNLYSTNFPAEGTLGAIRIVDENDISLTDPDGSAHYVLYSHGDNGRGGYTPLGVQKDNCNVTRLDLTVGVPYPGGPSTSPPGTDIEIENCDYNDAVYVRAIRSEAVGGSYSDDILLFAAEAFRPYWRNSFVDSSHIYNTNFGNVGIGTETPAQKLHILGDLAVETEAQANNGYCQGVSATCLDPAFLGGPEEPDVTLGRNICPAGQIAYAIGDDPATAYDGAEIICRDIDWSAALNRSCVPNAMGDPTYLRGVSNLGNIRCCTYNTNICEMQ